MCDCHAVALPARAATSTTRGVDESMDSRRFSSCENRCLRAIHRCITCCASERVRRSPSFSSPPPPLLLLLGRRRLLLRSLLIKNKPIETTLACQSSGESCRINRVAIFSALLEYCLRSARRPSVESGSIIVSARRLDSESSRAPGTKKIIRDSFSSRLKQSKTPVQVLPR